MTSTRRALALLLLGATACTSDFQPRSFLDDLRVLAVVDTIPEGGEPRLDLQPGERITLTPHRRAPAGVDPASLRESWTFCPFSVGAGVGYACAVPACEVTLAAGDSSADPELGVAATADPTALIEQCLAQVSDGGTLPPGIPTTLPKSFDLVFKYTVVAPGAANTPSGDTRVVVERVPFFPGGVPLPRNLPPRAICMSIGGVRVAGEAGCAPEGPVPPLAAGQRLEVKVELDPASAQPYEDSGGTPLTEVLLVSFFTDAGRFEYDRLVGTSVQQALKGEALPAGASTARVWAVASDLRGGQTVLGPLAVPVVGG